MPLAGPREIGNEMSANRSLKDAFGDPSSRVSVTSAFIDINGSTLMHQNEPEGSWVPQLGWFYEGVHELCVEAGFGIDEKYLGDGIMLTASSSHATEMVNLAIKVQEKIRKANRRSDDGGGGQINFNVSIGIVTGVATQFRSPDGLTDYVGKTIDTARRLCDAATARAIFIDTATQVSSNGSLISSIMGRAHDRLPEEYFGELSSIPVKGLKNPVNYFEILWEGDRFGVKNEVASVTALREAPLAGAVTATTSTALGTGKTERLAGRVKTWDPDRGFGFITSEAGEDLYFNRNLMAYEEDLDGLTPGARVGFIALPPSQVGKSRQAAVILIDGSDASGYVQSPASTERHYGWLVVEDSHRTRHFVYLPAHAAKGLAKGDQVDFTVKVGTQGASATDVEKVEGGENAA